MACKSGLITNKIQPPVNEQNPDFVNLNHFTFSGQPLKTKPISLSGFTETTKTVSRSEEIQYSDRNTITWNILDFTQTPFTTLRMNQNSYILQYIALHTNIFMGEDIRENLPANISLFFKPDTRNPGPDPNAILHLVFPIVNVSKPEDENTFLKFWLNTQTDEKLPLNFSLNDLFTFSDKTSNLTIRYTEQCLQYNRGSSKRTYHLLRFSEPLALLVQNPPKPNPTYLTANQVLNFLYRDTFINTDPKLLSTEEHFSKEVNSNLSCIAYSTTREAILGKPLVTQKQRKLNGVKCYPIDIFSQMDANGNVVIDESTKKPIDVNTVSNMDTMNLFASEGNLSVEQSKKRQKILYTIAWVLIGFVLLALLVGLIVYLTRAQTSVPSPIVTNSVSTGTGGTGTAPTPSSIQTATLKATQAFSKAQEATRKFGEDFA